jgi:hypothetical protein
MLHSVCRPFAQTALAIAMAAQTAAPSKDVPTIAHEAIPSVVRIVLRDDTGKELASGSGFVVASDGRVVTNYHLIHIATAAQAEARLPSGATYQVEGVAATDPDRDLAILKMRSTGTTFVPLRLGDPESMQVGARVVAIGSPLAGMTIVNTEETVADGIVSGKRDWEGGKMKVFQITAPLSPGSSGGALLNMDGDVVGVTFAQLAGGQNLNFAIPVTYVRPLLTDGPIHPLQDFRDKEEPLHSDANLSGSYTGVWQSNQFSVSGAATMTIRVDGLAVTAQVFLTGGEITTATLTGSATKAGENIWTAQLTSKKPRLSVRAIFRGNTFVGDYTYSHFLMVDHGQWLLKRE